MTDSEIANLEEWLHLKLPAPYVTLVQRLGSELQGLRGPLGAGRDRPFMIGVNEVLAINRNVRGPKSDWLDHLFVCGFEQVGNILYAIDCRQPQPRLLHIVSTSKDPFPPSAKKAEPCPKFADLTALYDYALEKYRRMGSKAKKGAPARPEPATKGADKKPTAAAPGAKVIDAMRRLLDEAGFELVPPKRKHSIEALTADVLTSLPNNLHALYTACDGGRCPRLNVKILPLHEAVAAARSYAVSPDQGTFPMGYFPVAADVNADSDLCCLCTRGPLSGYVVHVHHDGPDALKARSFESFFQVLGKNLGQANWRLEEADYDKRPTKHFPFELAGEDRTPGDLQAADELLRLAEQRRGANQEYEHVADIASKLFSRKQEKEIRQLCKHRDPDFQRLARLRLAELGLDKSGPTRSAKPSRRG